MGLLDFLFATAILNNLKKKRHDDDQQRHEHTSDYSRGYHPSYDDSCHDQEDHNDYDSHDTYDPDIYDDDCDCEFDW